MMMVSAGAILVYVGAFVIPFFIFASFHKSAGSVYLQQIERERHKVSDLIAIANAVENYYLENAALPKTLDALKPRPRLMYTDTYEYYEYKQVMTDAYELCADFQTDQIRDGGMQSFVVHLDNKISVWGLPQEKICFLLKVRMRDKRNFQFRNPLAGEPYESPLRYPYISSIDPFPKDLQLRYPYISSIDPFAGESYEYTPVRHLYVPRIDPLTGEPYKYTKRILVEKQNGKTCVSLKNDPAQRHCLK